MRESIARNAFQKNCHQGFIFTTWFLFFGSPETLASESHAFGSIFCSPYHTFKKNPSSYRLRFGFTVLTSFNEAAKDGKMVMPQPNDKVRGGLALGCFGMPWDAMGPHHTSSTVGAALVWASLNTIDLENCHFHPQWTGAPDPTRILS